MLIGLKRVDITPTIGLPLGGNVRSDNASRGINDPLFANIVVLKGSQYACFVELDLIGADRSLCNSLSQEIYRRTGIARESILINAIHTHSGPDVVLSRKEELDPRVRKYLDNMIISVAEGVEQASNEMVQGKLGAGKGYIDNLSFNRRVWLKDGTLHMNWENIAVEDIDRAAGPIDPEIYVIKLTDLNDAVLGVMVNFTLHPAILVGKDWLYSKDYINWLDKGLKETFGNSVHVYFANGAEGNVNHINIWNKEQKRDFSEAERIGRLLAEKAASIINNIEVSDSIEIKSISRELDMPIREITCEAVTEARKLLEEKGDYIPSLLDGVPEEVYAREIIRLSRMDKQFKTLLQVFKIGNSVIASLPGEVFVEFGLKLKEQSCYENTMLFGLANDYLGYIPTCNSFDEGGYEVKTCYNSKLQKNAGDIIVKNLQDMISAL